jgi:hypothetical protein
MKVRQTSEYEKFDRTMRDLMKIPRSEVKAKLDAGKRAKVKSGSLRRLPIRVVV